MVISCRHCGQKNRVPGERVADAGKCGKCGETLEVTGAPIAVTADQFDDLVANSPLPVVVDFWAPWCGPCRMAAPEVASLAEQTRGEVVVVKLNTEDHPQIAQREGVRGIPMFGLYEHGVRQRTATGLMKAAALRQQLGL